MADISAFDNIFDNFTKKSGFTRKRRKIPLKRHKMALKRHKMSPDPDKAIVPGLCNYYKLLILSEQNNVHTLETM